MERERERERERDQNNAFTNQYYVVVKVSQSQIKIHQCLNGFMFISRVQRKDSLFIHYVLKEGRCCVIAVIVHIYTCRLLHRILDLQAK
jgi:hypothetical protein